MSGKHRTRVRPRLRRLAITVLIVLAPVAAWSAWDYFEARRLARSVESVRAAGEPIAIAARPHSPAGPGKAARYYAASAALVDVDGLYESSGLLRRLDFPGGSSGEALPADLGAWLDRNRDAEELLIQATGLNEVAPLRDFTRNADAMLRVATLADLRAIERIQAQDVEGAAQALVRQLKVARLLQMPVNDLSVLTSSLVIGRALSALPHVLERQAAPDTLGAIRTALEFADRDDLLAQMLSSERAFLLSQYWDRDKRWFASREAPVVLGRRFSEPLLLLMRPYVTRQVIGQLALMQQLRDDASRPWPQRLMVDVADVGNEPPQSNSRLSFLLLHYSPWATVNAHRTRTATVGALLAATRVSLTALAIDRYRRAYAGVLPARLTDLVPEQIPAVPTDPFSGQPLLLKPLPDGYVVYSVGANRLDDGGRDANRQMRRRWGANQLHEQPADIGVKVRLLKGGASRARALAPASRLSSDAVTVDIHTLDSEFLRASRRLTVLRPRFRGRTDVRGPAPVLYLNDGQNLFEPHRAFAGNTWRVAETVNWMVRAGVIPPVLIVGIDHGGVNRAREYLPVEDERNPFARRPLGRHYVEFIAREVVPFIERTYDVSRRVSGRAFGGSSYGGVAALLTVLERPGLFGRLLIESPSLYVGGRLLLRKARRAPRWPSRVYLGVGTAETGKVEVDRETVDNVRSLESILKDAGLGPRRLKVVVQEGARHTEDAWAARLPEALAFLFGA